MPANVFVRFLERKLTEHRIGKVVPGNAALEQHAQHVLTRVLTNKALETIQAEEYTTSIPSPAKLHQQVAAALKRKPDIHWDLAVAVIAARCSTGTACRDRFVRPDFMASLEESGPSTPCRSTRSSHRVTI